MPMYSYDNDGNRKELKTFDDIRYEITTNPEFRKAFAKFFDVSPDYFISFGIEPEPELPKPS